MCSDRLVADAVAGGGEDTLSPLVPGSALNARAARLAALHADSPSATMSFAKLVSTPGATPRTMRLPRAVGLAHA